MLKNKHCPIEIKQLSELLEDACASANVLFMEFINGSMKVKDIYHRDFVVLYCDTLTAIKHETKMLQDNHASAARYWRVIDNSPDSIDRINQLLTCCSGKPLVQYLENCVLDILVASGFANASDSSFLLAHAERICASLRIITRYLNLLQAFNHEHDLSRINPITLPLLESESKIKLSGKKIPETLLRSLAERAKSADVFNDSRAFRYIDGQFVAAELNSIRPVDQFFGYSEVRRLFQQHFASFAAGESNLPLLISSLPGLGKTHFTIAYTLVHPELTLILPEPELLGKSFEIILRKLAARKDRKFVIFFDDLDPEKIDWYYFRTNVGGSFSLPNNISLVLAANYDFPANISSRGRGVTFPMFDEIRCQEMVMDFLVSVGMKHCRNELVSVIAADYCEEFGQKKFAELSPRTLIRYLERYKTSPGKRKQMLDFSKKEIITRPDAQIFYDFNVKILRMLYGEEAIEALRQEKIRQSL
jgi:predicted AAA+ superfamily ATPase